MGLAGLTGWFLGLYPSCCIIHLEDGTLFECITLLQMVQQLSMPGPNVLLAHDEVFCKLNTCDAVVVPQLSGLRRWCHEARLWPCRPRLLWQR